MAETTIPISSAPEGYRDTEASVQQKTEASEGSKGALLRLLKKHLGPEGRLQKRLARTGREAIPMQHIDSLEDARDVLNQIHGERTGEQQEHINQLVASVESDTTRTRLEEGKVRESLHDISEQDIQNVVDLIRHAREQNANLCQRGEGAENNAGERSDVMYFQDENGIVVTTIRASDGMYTLGEDGMTIVPIDPDNFHMKIMSMRYVPSTQDSPAQLGLRSGDGDLWTTLPGGDHMATPAVRNAILQKQTQAGLTNAIAINTQLVGAEVGRKGETVVRKGENGETHEEEVMVAETVPVRVIHISAQRQENSGLPDDIHALVDTAYQDQKESIGQDQKAKLLLGDEKLQAMTRDTMHLADTIMVAQQAPETEEQKQQEQLSRGESAYKRLLGEAANRPLNTQPGRETALYALLVGAGGKEHLFQESQPEGIRGENPLSALGLREDIAEAAIYVLGQADDPTDVVALLDQIKTAWGVKALQEEKIFENTLALFLSKEQLVDYLRAKYQRASDEANAQVALARTEAAR